ncbi:MAG: hypothetical protein FWB95_03270 [Treponema sp.]|nr:hypothetical protein [Treponema sp.]
MADNKILPLVLSAAVFFISASVLCAQEEAEPLQPGYHIDYSGGEAKFIQRLMWDKDQYALYYEIEIQIYKETYTDYYYQIVKEEYINLSLPPGQYRYSITAFDLLERRGETSEWMEFRVIAAYQPGINRIVPESFYMDQMTERILHISGSNIFEESVIYLRDQEKYIFPVEKIYVNTSRIRLVFDDERLVPGNYNIIIENPGGLVFSYDGFFIGYKKPLDVFIKMSFNPAIPVYGDLKDMFGPKLYLPCIGLSIEAISSKRTFFNAGMEFAASVYVLSPVTALRFNMQEIYDSYSNIGKGMAFVDFDMNVALQKRFNKIRNMITFRIGGGVSLLANTGGSGVNEAAAHANAGISALFLLFDIMHIETGVDFSYYIGSSTFALIKPKVSIVWKK